ncbi:hypothetical protein SAMN02745216_02542 [Desulfatibacillum alkenivorans DSM 16219]|uniref:Uncharacterized protein n=1 Tax=Desulfatibacillum alkenivorans DSM 16219 TaxID=1121393 RepID=A0A1M6N7L7_9BACT|nr:hypothetical protein SAMN02745216_02542 [Desulfatibacillum alkenivorans DSM 16219]
MGLCGDNTENRKQNEKFHLSVLKMEIIMAFVHWSLLKQQAPLVLYTKSESGGFCSL